MKKVYLTWQDVQRYTQEILRQITLSNWQPDYVVGITRGGLVPANLISQYLDVPMETLKVSLRDDNSQPESNLWMAEDAFGDNENGGKNILIVNDINDSGATLNWIKHDWQNGCYGNDERWHTDVWGKNVRVAVLYDNEISNAEIPVSYSAVDINKSVDPTWINYPWEDWWKR